MCFPSRQNGNTPTLRFWQERCPSGPASAEGLALGTVLPLADASEGFLISNDFSNVITPFRSGGPFRPRVSVSSKVTYIKRQECPQETRVTTTGGSLSSHITAVPVMVLEDPVLQHKEGVVVTGGLLLLVCLVEEE